MSTALVLYPPERDLRVDTCFRCLEEHSAWPLPCGHFMCDDCFRMNSDDWNFKCQDDSCGHPSVTLELLSGLHSLVITKTMISFPRGLGSTTAADLLNSLPQKLLVVPRMKIQDFSKVLPSQRRLDQHLPLPPNLFTLWLEKPKKH